MEKISKEQFNEVDSSYNEETEEEEIVDMDKLLREMENPVTAQKALAVQIKIFLDKRMKQDLDEKGILTENTRRWVDSYNSILEKLQKSLHGDKSVNLHLHKVTHSDISNKIRESIFTLEKEKTEEEK